MFIDGGSGPPNPNGGMKMTQDQIKALRTSELRVIVRSTNPTGKFAAEVVWAREELKRRSA